MPGKLIRGQRCLVDQHRAVRNGVSTIEELLNQQLYQARVTHELVEVRGPLVNPKQAPQRPLGV
ncbi:MAG: hypothetical protein O3C60_12140 [Planctomycetota bacterium]|nr:hypothetical protein [Planctomycetota bacterium]